MKRNIYFRSLIFILRYGLCSIFVIAYEISGKSLLDNFHMIPVFVLVAIIGVTLAFFLDKGSKDISGAMQ